MKRKDWTVLVLAASLGGTGWISAKEIQPRAEDARWDFTAYYFEDGKQVSGGTSRETVVEVKKLEGKTIYRIELLTDWRTLFERLMGAEIDPDSYSYYWEYLSDEGSYNFWEDWEDPAPPSSLSDFALTLPFPTEAGHEYEADGLSYEVLSVDEEITVPAGTFEAVVYQMTDLVEDDADASMRERYYMAPHVGLIRYEYDFMDGSGEWVIDTREDLFSYSMAENE
ncbi:MAG: hypothetical protein AAGJ81_11415 [Verrucomicrobiota bacterium]